MSFIDDAVHAYDDEANFARMQKRSQEELERWTAEQYLTDRYPGYQFVYKGRRTDIAVKERTDYLGSVRKSQTKVTRLKFSVDSADFGLEFMNGFNSNQPRIAVAYLDCPICFGEKITPLRFVVSHNNPEESKKSLLAAYGKALSDDTGCVACNNNVCEECGSLLEDQ